jgi:hypothetical protein
MTAETDFTSRLAWERYKAEGKVPRSQREVIAVMESEETPMNQRMIDEAVRQRFGRRIGTGQKAVYIMERMETVEQSHVARDPETDHLSVYYRLTFRPPIMTTKQASEMSRKDVIAGLRAELAQAYETIRQLREREASRPSLGQQTFF